MRSHAFLALASAALFLIAGPTVAQEDMVTDRPDQTESAVTIAPGKIQIETGVLFTREETAGTSFEITEALGTLARIGLNERSELRIGFDGWVSTPGADGFGDASLGVKYLLAEETANSPQIAVLVESSVPTGESGITSDDYTPAARLALSKDFGANLGIGFNIGAEFPDSQEVLFYTLAAGVGLDDRNGVFFEIFGDDESNHSFDTGWTFLAQPNLQFDIAVGLGLTDEAPDYFVGVGLSLRVPN